jgi:phage terminase large subunit GpA-like protein
VLKLISEYIQLKSDDDFLIESINERKTKKRTLTVPEYAETTVISAGKYRGAKFLNSRAPYLIEPMECMNPGSDIQDVRLMFPAQSGKTTAWELACLYYMAIKPSEILYVAATMPSAIKWITKRIEPRASQQGIIFKAQTEINSTRRSGNTVIQKDFPGGNLDLASACSASSLASETKRIVGMDELDRWKEELKKEGSPFDIAYARTQGWGNQRKIMAFSTPTTYEESLILPLYEDGDCRQFWVNCPICGEPQLLTLYEWANHGLKWETINGRLDEDSIRYTCPHCSQDWYEHQKGAVLLTGIWKPSREPRTPYIRSYHINGIYSPFLLWKDIAAEFELTRNNQEKLQTFTNLKMGMPYKISGTRPDVKDIIQLRGTYKAGDIPPGVLFLVVGVDCQRGSAKDLNNKQRIEYEVLGIGAGMRTWSIDYQRMEGDIYNAFSPLWTGFLELMKNVEYTRADGMKFKIDMIFIDSSDGDTSDVIYNVARRMSYVYPIKGEKTIQLKKNEFFDELSTRSDTPFKQRRIDADLVCYHISTLHYKDRIYRSLKIVRTNKEVQPMGFFDFSKSHSDRYFEMLVSEERTKKGYDSGGRRNESLDVKVYGCCAGDVFLRMYLDDMRAEAKIKGVSAYECSLINTHDALKELILETKNENYYKGDPCPYNVFWKGNKK